MSGDNDLLMWEGREEKQQQNIENGDNDLGESHATTFKSDAQRLGRIQQKGAWLSVLP